MKNNRVEKATKYKFIDLFAGIGGFRIAFEDLGGECVFTSEFDESCQKVYNLNFNEIPKGDIKTINESSIPDFDILLGGFPCQPFSFAGRLEGFNDKNRGTLFFDILRIIKAKSPEMFLLENVKGLKSHNKGETMRAILDSLTSAGYHVSWTILNSHDFGVPQYRDRWYCVGFKQEVEFQFPSGEKRGIKLNKIIDLNEKDEKLKLTAFEVDRIKHHFRSKEIRVKHDNSKYAPNTKKGKHGVYSFLKPDNTLRFHIGDEAKTQIQEAYYASIDSVSCSIIAAREPKLWDLERKLSVKECSRLQGFPEWFKFNVPDSVAKKQLGNAVTVNVIRAIGERMIEAYNASALKKKIKPSKSKSKLA